MVYDGHRGHRKGNEKPMPCLEDSNFLTLSLEGHTLIPSDYTGWSMGIFLAGSFSHTTEKIINQQFCGNST